MVVGSGASTLAETALLELNLADLRSLVNESLTTATPLEVFEKVVEPAMVRIGRAWEMGDLSLANVYMASRLVERLVDEHLVTGARTHTPHPPLAMAVLGDHHLLGKRLVLAALRMAGWAVEDWGVAMDPVILAQQAHERGIGILLISTLMDRSARRVAEVVRVLKSLGASTRVVVGGAPFRLNPELCREVGADATAPVASAVPGLLTSLVGVP